MGKIDFNPNKDARVGDVDRLPASGPASASNPVNNVAHGGDPVAAAEDLWQHAQDFKVTIPRQEVEVIGLGYSLKPYQFVLEEGTVCDALVAPRDLSDEADLAIQAMGYTYVTPFLPDLQKAVNERGGRLYVETADVANNLEPRFDYRMANSFRRVEQDEVAMAQ